MSKELLELHMDQDKQRFDAIDKQLAAGDARMASIDGKLDSLIATANKQKGFIAGMASMASMLVTTIVGLCVYIWQKHFGG